MKDQNYLALVYDTQSLEDLTRSCITEKSLTILAPLKLVKENEGLVKKFSKVIPVKDYLNSAHLESLVVAQHNKRPFDKILALHEVDILRGAYLRQSLNIQGQNVESAHAFRSKTTMKRYLEAKNILVPKFRALTTPLDCLDFINTTSFPVILKPDLGTGSRGVFIIESKRQLLSLFKKKNIFPANQPLDWQIEEFISGEMYHINGIVYHGNIIASWPSHYPHQSIEMTRGCFASSILLSRENPLTDQLNTYAHKVIQALPFPRHMVFHLEVFVTKNKEIIFCEIACRIGGKGVRNSWLESFEIDLGKIFTESQVFWESFILENSPHLNPKILSGEIWFPARQGTLQSIEKTCPYPWVKEYQVFFKTGDRISKAQDINECLAGTSLFTGQDESQMHERLRQFVNWFNSHTLWHENS